MKNIGEIVALVETDSEEVRLISYNYTDDSITTIYNGGIYEDEE